MSAAATLDIYALSPCRAAYAARRYAPCCAHAFIDGLCCLMIRAAFYMLASAADMLRLTPCRLFMRARAAIERLRAFDARTPLRPARACFHAGAFSNTRYAICATACFATP